MGKEGRKGTGKKETICGRGKNKGKEKDKMWRGVDKEMERGREQDEKGERKKGNGKEKVIPWKREG